MEEMTEKACPMCKRENPPIGVLGNLIWYRCQGCGMEYCAHCELGTEQALRTKELQKANL